MPSQRVYPYDGNDKDYAISLLDRIITIIGLPECIRQLETQAQTARKTGLFHGSQVVEPPSRDDRSAEHSDQRITPPLETHDQTVDQDQTNASSGSQCAYYSTPPLSCDGLVIEHFDPKTITQRPTSRSSASHLSPNSYRRVKSFLDGLPTSESAWARNRVKAGLCTDSKIIGIIDFLTGRAKYPNNSTKYTPNHTIDMSIALDQFANGAGSLVKQETINRNCCHFFSLIFVATCCVAKNQGRSDLCDAALRTFLKAGGRDDISSRLPRRFRRAVLWLLQEMERQFRRGLEHRGLEIWFMSGQSLDYYRHFPRTEEFVTKLIPKCELPLPNEIQAYLPLWIPFFVKFHVGDRWSYETICSALGVTLFSQEEDFRQFEERYRKSKELGILPLASRPDAPNAATSELPIASQLSSGRCHAATEAINGSPSPAHSPTGALCENSTRQFRPINSLKRAGGWSDQAPNMKRPRPNQAESAMIVPASDGSLPSRPPLDHGGMGGDSSTQQSVSSDPSTNLAVSPDLSSSGGDDGDSSVSGLSPSPARLSTAEPPLVCQTGLDRTGTEALPQSNKLVRAQSFAATSSSHAASSSIGGTYIVHGMISGEHTTNLANILQRSIVDQSVQTPALFGGSSGETSTCDLCNSNHGSCMHALLDAARADLGATRSASGHVQSNASVSLLDGSSLPIAQLMGAAPVPDIADSQEQGRLTNTSGQSLMDAHMQDQRGHRYTIGANPDAMLTGPELLGPEPSRSAIPGAQHDWDGTETNMLPCTRFVLDLYMEL